MASRHEVSSCQDVISLFVALWQFGRGTHKDVIPTLIFLIIWASSGTVIFLMYHKLYYLLRPDLDCLPR